MNLWKSKKRREQEEEDRLRRQREDQYWSRKREEEEKRWKELAEKYGVDRDEAEYQFTNGLTLWNPRDGEQRQKLTPGHVGIIRIVRRNTGERAAIEPYNFSEVRFKWIDEVKKIESKENANVFTSGASGAGKSSLVRLLLRKFEGHQKIIFSFKVNDTHLRIGYPVADVSELVPNPFADAEAFVSAFAIAFPVSAIGVTASQVPSLVQELSYGCNSLRDFDRNIERRIRDTKDKVQLSALYFIQEHAKSLQQRETDHKRKTDLINLALERGLNVVLDFSKLSDSAKTFYAELLLRGMWNRVRKRKEAPAGAPKSKAIIYVDEAHRLTRGTFEKYHSVLSEMAREIREQGALWTSTQNYTDIEDDMRNQFAAQYVFSTSSKSDLEALKAIDPMLSWTVSTLPKHHFVDAKSKFVHQDIPVYTFGPDEEADVQSGSLEESLAGSTDSPPHADSDVDYYEKVRDALAGEGVTWISRLASQLNQENGVDKDAAKLKVRNVLLKLLEAGEVQVQRLDDPESGETVSLYFAKGTDENEGPLHRWMVRKIVESHSEDVNRVASSGEALPDIETQSEYVEVETGLKRRIDDLQERVTKFSQSKPVVIVVPNQDLAEAYSKKLAGGRVIVKTLREFLQDNARP